jgi:dTDP-4-dehydrorhamnose reductase
VKRLLITGISGLLGSNLARLTADRYHVIGVMRGEHAVLSPQQTSIEVLNADLAVPEQAARVVDTVRPDILIHCAAMTDVDRCEADPVGAAQMNTHLPATLAEAARRGGVQFVHISTDAVFDGQQEMYCEEDQPLPINVYARTKYAGELRVAEAFPEALIARVNFFGWSWQGRRSLAEWFFNNLSAGKSISGFSDLVFCPLLVNDMVSLLLRMIELRLSGLYHVVSSESVSKYTFGQMLAREFGFDEALITPASYLSAGLKAPRPKLLSLKSEKLAHAIGEPLPAQTPAIRRYVELYRQGYPRSLRSLFVEPGKTPGSLGHAGSMETAVVG